MHLLQATRPSCPNSRRQHRLRIRSLALALVFALAPTLAAASKSAIRFPNSIRSVLSASEAGTSPSSHTTYISRTSLTPAEASASMSVEFALRMRNFDELQGRIARGERIAPSEMQARYFPTLDDQQQLLDWLKSQGFAISRTDPTHLAVFARAPVSTLSHALNASFARVTRGTSNYTSAISAPSLPSAIAPFVLGIHGLQPQQRIHLLNHLSSQAVSGNQPPYLPNQIAAVYNATSTGLTGSGQTIAIFSAAFPSSSDLTAFWTLAGSSASSANVTLIALNGGPSSTFDATSMEEADLDVEWAGAMAPAAAIRVYGGDLTDSAVLDEAFLKVYADLPANPTLHQFSISFGYAEDEVDQDYLLIESQYVAALASAGVTVVASSGDLGGYADSAKPLVLQVNYPASDPDVTGVGGTTLRLNTDGSVATETTWSGSGGGVSAYFSRPAWQTGTGVASGSKRLVPDVAAAADPSTGALIYSSGKQYTVGGTSWATPVWAGLCALINQSRSAAGLSPLGALNARLYPLLGTSAFRDITTGSNGTFSALTGYDMCTGLGVPNLAVLVQDSLSAASSPAVIAQESNRFTTAGQSVTFAISAVGGSSLSYNWQRLPSGSSTWTQLSDDATYQGSKTNSLLITEATAAMADDQFDCVVSNSSGAVTSAPASLSIGTTGVSTLAGWAGAYGSQDGLASNARFNYPGGICVDSSGNVYVSDGQNYTIRKITAQGLVSTVAGLAGSSGTTDGPASSARFSGVGGVASSPSGDLFVADTGNYTIRKITPAGVVSTLAGRAGVSGHVDGSGTAAEFSDPENLTVDSSGNVYVADGAGNTIRKITPAGVVSTLAGTGTKGSTDGAAASASFNMPLAVAVDSSGNVYVADSGNSTIRIINTSGIVSTLAGLAGVTGSIDDFGSRARFDTPSGLTVDSSGNLYVADSVNDTIRKVSPTGGVTTVAGQAGSFEATDDYPLSARFNQPADVAIDASGVLYVADSLNNNVRRIVLSPLHPPTISSGPTSIDVAADTAALFSVSASGSAPLSYQWYKDGTAVAGATGPTLTLSSVSTLAQGSYTCTVTNIAGMATSSAASLVVDPLAVSNPSAHLTSISTRTYVETGANVQIAGISISGTTPKTVLIRASGPALEPYGITDFLPDPTLTLQDQSGAVIATNDNWGDDPTQVAALTAAFTQTSAFAWPSGSKDAALLITLKPGLYTATVQDKNGGSGVALVEVYEVDHPESRLVDISTRSSVATGDNVQIAGFAINGSGLKTVLIRASGPALAPYGISNYLPDPTLTLYNQAGTPIATNDNWGDDPHEVPLIKAAAAATAAFAWPDGSNDAALLVTLPPGLYTAITKDKNGATGVALIEVYEVK